MFALSFALISGFCGLIYSAARFVEGSVNIAKFFQLSPLVIGLTLVALGTSAPEMFVSAVAAINGSPQLGVGNALGSNIANVGLVLGCTAVIVSLPLIQSVISTQLPLLILITLVAGAFLWDSSLDRIEGIMLLLLLITYLILTVKLSKNTDASEISERSLSVAKAWVLLIVGIIGLIIFSQSLVWGAKGLAREFGISELVIGLTAVAIGTSLPELAATLVSALKGERDLAIGNIIGSNIFNLLGVMGIAAIIQPINLDPQVLSRDYLAMLLLSLALYLAVLPKLWNNKAKLKIDRVLGALFLIAYTTYFVILL